MLNLCSLIFIAFVSIVIKTPLRMISNLHPVSSTLRRLCINNCSITKMENLFLPNLKELYLYNNAITKVSSTSGLPLCSLEHNLLNLSIYNTFICIGVLRLMWYKIGTLRTKGAYRKLLDCQLQLESWWNVLCVLCRFDSIT